MRPTPSNNAVDWTKVLLERINGLRFGTVQVVVHQGRVTQIEATEKIRFEDPAKAPFQSPPDHWNGATPVKQSPLTGVPVNRTTEESL